MGVVHGEGKYADAVSHCDQCPAKYASEAKLREHIMSKHMGVKFPCEHCGKKFMQKASVVSHIKSGKCQVLAEAEAANHAQPESEEEDDEEEEEEESEKGQDLAGRSGNHTIGLKIELKDEESGGRGGRREGPQQRQQQPPPLGHAGSAPYFA